MQAALAEMATNPRLLLDSIAAERERRELARVAANADAIREQCRTLAGFVRAAWKYIDPADFVDNWHIDAICEHLEAVTFGQCRRLIINIPPRHMKSLLVSVAWPAWVWTLERTTPLSGPGVGFLSTSYAQSLSVRDNLKCRRLIESPWYRALWGTAFSLTSDQNTKIRFENDRGGYRIASSVDGTATGEGGHVVTVDDALSAKDAESETARDNVNDWWDNTMSTRLNDPKTGAYVLVMQRIHEKDLVGHVLRRSPGEFTHLCLPARYEREHPYVWARDPRTEERQLLWPDRMGEAEVSSLEISLGSYGAAGQLQQRPAPRDGGMFKRHWFKIVAAAPAGGIKVRKWDLAATEEGLGSDPDWTAGCLMSKSRDGFFYIEGMERFREGPHGVERAVINTATRDGKFISIHLNQDPAQAGKAQAAAFVRMLAGWPVRAEIESGSKITRATAFSAQCEAGNVFLVDGPWVEPFLDEICAFPNGAKDDQVDASAGAFNQLAQRQKSFIAGPIIVGGPRNSPG